MRVVGSLQSRGYLVWVDTEQMKGATVDTMALAVEGSAVVLLGVSRAYKESSNCRMEAQYALQKKKPLVPLMLVDGYEADGWLGLMLGTSLWYALYGATLTSEGAFEDRMDALCRELGDRGRADVEVAGLSPSHDQVPQAHPIPESDAVVALRSELGAMKLKALKQRAIEAGVDAEAVADADDADDVKAEVIRLILERSRAADEDAGAQLCESLGGLKLKALKQRALEEGVDTEAIADADDADDVKAAVIELIMRQKRHG